MAAALLAKILPFGLFETRRLVGAAVGIAGLAVTWRIARRIGGPRAGLIALLLLAACPPREGNKKPKGWFKSLDGGYVLADRIWPFSRGPLCSVRSMNF